MKTAIINVKTDPDVKAKAQEVASQLGFSLSSLINGYIINLIKTKAVYFSTHPQPSNYLLKSLEESEIELKSGKTSPEFDNPEEAISWLKSA